jgi:hypothetical protein
MQLRTSIIAACATVAILAPAAAARIPDPSPNGDYGTAYGWTVHSTLIKSKQKAAARQSVQLVTENSRGQHKSTAKKAKAKVKVAVKRSAPKAKPVTHVVPPIIEVAPGPLVPTSGDSDCLTFMTNCTAEQYCTLWGFNCAGYEDSEGQPADSEPAASQPAASQPAASQPTASQPAASQPAASEPAASQPDASQVLTSQADPSQPAESGN